MFRRFISTCKDSHGKSMFYPKYGTSLYEHRSYEIPRDESPNRGTSAAHPKFVSTKPFIFGNRVYGGGKGGSEANVDNPSVKAQVESIELQNTESCVNSVDSFQRY
jgi:hypothetical protein